MASRSGIVVNAEVGRRTAGISGRILPCARLCFGARASSRHPIRGERQGREYGSAVCGRTVRGSRSRADFKEWRRVDRRLDGVKLGVSYTGRVL